jgi:hypothetical protein
MAIEFLLACGGLLSETYKIFIKQVPGWYKRGGMSFDDHQLKVVVFYFNRLFLIFASVVIVLITYAPDTDVGPLKILVTVTELLFRSWLGRAYIITNILLTMFVPAD